MSKSNYHKKLGRAGWIDNEHTSRSKESNFYDEDYSLEKPSTGKKKKKHPAPKKCNHKHEYEEVICTYEINILGQHKPEAVIRDRCTICGEMKGWKHPTIKDSEHYFSRSMTYEEILKNFPNLTILEMD